MIVTKVVIYSLVFINLPSSLASNKPRLKTHWNWEEFLEQQLGHGIGRQSKTFDVDKHVNLIWHEDQTIPKSFDARQEWPMCESLSRVKTQSTCGTSWAFASGMLTNDRVCIASNGSTKFDVSEQDIITCCEECFPLNASSRCNYSEQILKPVLSIAYIIQHGVVDAECKPYNVITIEDGCKQSCENGKSYEKNNLNISFIAAAIVAHKNMERPDLTATLKEIQIEIMKYGPVASTLDDIPYDFQNEYTNQVYTYTINPDHEFKNVSKNESHVVKIIGWGIEDGTPYWLCANSWGDTWGQLGGFFKIRRGSNDLGIESLFVTVDTDPESRRKWSDELTTKKSSSPTNFTKILFYEITIVLVIALNV